jgi:D-alanyl-D-alanine dipeptidase
MNKIVNTFQLKIIYTVVFLLTAGTTIAQDATLNKYGLRVVSSLSIFKKTVLKSPEKQMIDLNKDIPTIILDLRYASTSNFMKEKLYPAITTTYLRKPAADALAKIQIQLKGMGLGLKIFDAYRPYSITEKMWEPVQDDRYAADPKKGSGHNRGIAIDLTIINLQTGEELAMGSDFDNFTDTAHHAFTNLPEEILQNRLLLKKTMEQYGFKALDTEWWHYSLPNAIDFELLDIKFNQLKETSRTKKTTTHAKRKFN